MSDIPDANHSRLVLLLLLLLLLVLLLQGLIKVYSSFVIGNINSAVLDASEKCCVVKSS